MPARLKVMGLLFCFAGALAALSMSYDILTGSEVNVRLSVLLIPVGLGLMKGRRSSQRWAMAWIAYGLVITAVLVVFIVSAPSEASISAFGYHRTGTGVAVLALATFSAYGVLLVWMACALISPSVRAFNVSQRRSGDGSVHAVADSSSSDASDELRPA